MPFCLFVFPFLFLFSLYFLTSCLFSSQPGSGNSQGSIDRTQRKSNHQQKHKHKFFENVSVCRVDGEDFEAIFEGHLVRGGGGEEIELNLVVDGGREGGRELKRG